MSTLTPTQITALKADFVHRTTVGDALFSQALADAANSGNDQAIADFYNTIVVPTFFVWQTAVPVNDILNAITWANFTPAAAVNNPDLQTWMNRCLSAQTKQMNLQNLLLNRTVIDASRDNIRAGFQDCLSGLATGPAGAQTDAGSAAVNAVLSRGARLVEKVLANTAGGSGADNTHVAKLTFEGQISAGDAGNLR